MCSSSLRCASVRSVLSPALRGALELMPKHAHPMNVMLAAVALLGTMNPETNPATDHSQQCDIFDQLIGSLGPVLLYWYHFAYFGKRIDTSQCGRKANGSPDTIARHFMRLLRNDGREPEEVYVRAIDTSLILYAEHGFAASTFACRVTTSTQSDVYSAIATAIGTLRGTLHGGANEAAMQLIERFNSPDEAEAGVKAMLARKELVYGFGHAIYKKGDPRSNIIKECSRELSKTKTGKPILFDISEKIESVRTHAHTCCRLVLFCSRCCAAAGNVMPRRQVWTQTWAHHSLSLLSLLSPLLAVAASLSPSARCCSVHDEREEDLSEFGFLRRLRLPPVRRADGLLHAHLCHRANGWMGSAHHRAEKEQQTLPTLRHLHRTREKGVRAHQAEKGTGRHGKVVNNDSDTQRTTTCG